MMNTSRRSMLRRAITTVVVGLLLCMAAAAETSTIFTFSTAPNATSKGNPMAAQAAITVSSNHIQIILTNLLSDSKSVGQSLSFLFFQVCLLYTSDAAD